jgi:hypothetical protein
MADELEEDLSKRANKRYFITIAWPQFLTPIPVRSLKLKSAFAFDKHFEQFEGIARLP